MCPNAPCIYAQSGCGDGVPPQRNWPISPEAEAVHNVSTVISLKCLSHAIVNLVVVSASLGRSSSGWGTELLDSITSMSNEGAAESRSAPLSKHTYWSRKTKDSPIYNLEGLGVPQRARAKLFDTIVGWIFG